MAKPLVIVESPAKARTLERFLGNRYAVMASVGHVRDLPESAKEIPDSIKKKPWARMGVDVDADFTPYYVIPADKKGFRNLAIGDLLLETLRGLDLQWPAADFDVAKQKQRLLDEPPIS